MVRRYLKSRIKLPTAFLIGELCIANSVIFNNLNVAAALLILLLKASITANVFNGRL